MSEHQLSCPKCGGVMIEGDFSAGGNVPFRWQATRIGKLFRMKVKVPDGPGYNVIGYRCAACGYVEVYAKTTS